MFKLLKTNLVIVTAFVVIAFITGLLLFTSPGLVGIDGYYHISIASVIWNEGITFAFPWLEFTLLDQDHYVDMHMLFHILQSPFTALLPLDDAARLSAAFFLATAAAIFVWLLQRYEVPYPLLWLLILLILSEAFLYRMMMSRPPVFALIYSWLAFYSLMQRKHLMLAIVACLFVWTYKVFPILLPMAVVGIFVIWIERGQLDIKPLLAVLAGFAVGLVINPYFPDNISFLWNAIHMKILSDGYVTSVGNEWYPLTTLNLLKDAAIPLAAYLLGLLLTDRHDWRRDPARLFWFLMATLWLLMLFKSRRFIEFFPPAALLFLIFALRPWLHHSWSKLIKQKLLWIPGGIAVALLLFGAYHTLGGEYERLQKRQPVEAYAGASQWLSTHTEAGTRVFQTDWDDFPLLFFHNRHNTYTLGLDPDYMRLKDEGLYDIWKLISRGNIRHPEDLIRDQFDSEYVFTDTKHKAFIRIAERNARMQKVYSDRYARVYRVIAAKEESP